MDARAAHLPRAERLFQHAPGSRSPPPLTPPPPAHLLSSRICARVQQAVGASGHFRSRAAIRAVAAAAAALLRPGRRWGETKGGRGLKPEPQRGGSRERRSGKLSRGRRRAGNRALCAPRAFASPAGSPEMHLHQVLTGAVNPGDNCYSVGSVEDVPFTVSGSPGV